MKYTHTKALSSSQKGFIFSNCDAMTPREIAKAINKSYACVKAFMDNYCLCKNQAEAKIV